MSKRTDNGSIRAGIYARVSTKKKDQAQSVPNQISSCTAFCERNGWEVVAVHSDTKTAYQNESMERREGWQAVVDLAAAGLIDIVVVTHRDRMSRNRREYDDIKRDVFSPYGVEIVPLMGVRVDPNIIQTRWMEEDEVTQAQRFSEMIGWKTYNGQQERLIDGYWPYKTPFGCSKSEEKGVPVRHPRNWPVLEAMFAMAAEGATIGEVRAWLEDGEHPAAGGGGWSNTSVQRCLGNPFYLGEYWVDGTVYTLRHQCRIDRDLWQDAQGEQKPKARGGRPRSAEYVYLIPRVVTSHYRLTWPASREGEALPLYGRYTIGRGGVQYPYYYRADKTKASGRVVAATVDPEIAPLDGQGSVRSAIRADHLDYRVVKYLIKLTDGQLSYQMRMGIDQRVGELMARRAATIRQLAEVNRERRGVERTIGELAVAGDLGPVVRTLNSKLQELIEAADSNEKLLNKIDRETDVLTQDEADHRAARAQLNAVELLWSRKAFTELSAVLALVVSYVDIRLDQPMLWLNPVMKSGTKAALTGLEPVFPP